MADKWNQLSDDEQEIQTQKHEILRKESHNSQKNKSSQQHDQRDQQKQRKYPGRYDMTQQIKGFEHDQVRLNIFNCDYNADSQDVIDAYKKFPDIQFQKVHKYSRGAFYLDFADRATAIDFIKNSPIQILNRKFTMCVAEQQHAATFQAKQKKPFKKQLSKQESQQENKENKPESPVKKQSNKFQAFMNQDLDSEEERELEEERLKAEEKQILEQQQKLKRQQEIEERQRQEQEENERQVEENKKQQEDRKKQQQKDREEKRQQKKDNEKAKKEAEQEKVKQEKFEEKYEKQEKQKPTFQPHKTPTDYVPYGFTRGNSNKQENLSQVPQVQKQSSKQAANIFGGVAKDDPELLKRISEQKKKDDEQLQKIQIQAVEGERKHTLEELKAIQEEKERKRQQRIIEQQQKNEQVTQQQKEQEEEQEEKVQEQSKPQEQQIPKQESAKKKKVVVSSSEEEEWEVPSKVHKGGKKTIRK